MSKYFFERGIRFECQNCGACCDVENGVVYLSEEDMIKIPKFLGISQDDFRLKYTARDEDGNNIIKDGHPSKCRFLFQNKCMIYPVRPVQCRTYPFWSSNLQDEKKFFSLPCPGIGKGKIVGAETIQEMFLEHREFLAKLFGLI
ncbi:YkgJ family cysteine cluster protein [candidate division WOR-3 bacterium]|nr:YkgJ family cysteine cluster protein [candidate division WOR-3 bacterium]